MLDDAATRRVLTNVTDEPRRFENKGGFNLLIKDGKTRVYFPAPKFKYGKIHALNAQLYFT